MAGGRPTDYTEEIVEKTKHYIETFEGDPVPQIAGLAVFLGVARSTIYEWAEQHKEFSDVLERLKAKQEKMLISGGLLGKFNSTITKLALTKHNYSDKIDTDLTSKGEKIDVFTPTQVARIAREVLNGDTTATESPE